MPKASCRRKANHTAWPAGQKKNTRVMASCGASSSIGRAMPPKTVLRFKPPPRLLGPVMPSGAGWRPDGPWHLRHTSEIRLRRGAEAGDVEAAEFQRAVADRQ